MAHSQSCLLVGWSAGAFPGKGFASRGCTSDGSTGVTDGVMIAAIGPAGLESSADASRAARMRSVALSRIEFSLRGSIPLSTSSRFTSRSHVRLKSSEARRNSCRLLPIWRLSCGRRRGPKKIRAAARISSSSELPTESRIKRNTTLPFDNFDAASLKIDCSAVGNRQYRTGERQ